MAVSDLIKQINEVVENPPAPDAVSEEERVTLLASLEKLRNVVEAPIDFTTRVIFSAHGQVSLRIGIESGIFNTMAAIGTGDLTASEIAQETGAAPLLVSRVMKLLAAMGLFKEVAEDKYANGPFAPYYDWLKTEPEQAFAFNTTMMLQRMDRGEPWYDYYPVLSKIETPVDEKAPLMVDVGGNTGIKLNDFHAKFPELPGRLALEDLPKVISSIQELDPAIERVVHSFLEPQPETAKGAKFYILGTILHDWPDAECRTILSHIRNAMNKDSILLLSENAVLDTNAGLYQVKLDFVMMSLLAATDRTTKQFRALPESEGLEAQGGQTWKWVLV
ncbi:hypothetical protein BCON_0201g00170 [Botryotinia convoluta]|uniref:Uncharacterized protein n=1 Tax=Botryotinia convoluta TaxID=54673 RepID=A0A4Z1HKW3_9HELO|nr:hypothetical protein BCON_0201g00170 [Botryotinia convoluta]